MNKEDIEELKREIKALKQANIEYKDRIDKALRNIILMFDEGDDSKIIRHLLEIDKILRGESND